jgi:pimeloyl-ACP methyl ester carboxylesterase
VRELAGEGPFLDPALYAATRSVTLGYRQFGSGPPLVLIMGLGGTMRFWPFRLLRLLAERFQVTIFDNRGVGDSTDDVGEEMTIELMARDTADLISRLGLARPGVVGWSMGGQIALALAVDHPGVTGPVVTVAGDCGSPNAIQPDSAIESVFTPEMTTAQLIELLFPAGEVAAKRAYSAEVLANAGGVRSATLSRQLDAETAFAASWHVYDSLPTLELPVLILQGSEDAVTSPHNAEILAKSIPGSQLVWFQGAGHGVAFQEPDRFLETVTPFLLRWPLEPEPSKARS